MSETASQPPALAAAGPPPLEQAGPGGPPPLEAAAGGPPPLEEPALPPGERCRRSSSADCQLALHFHISHHACNAPHEYTLSSYHIMLQG